MRTFLRAVFIQFGHFLKKINKYKAKNAYLMKVLLSKTSGSTLLQSTIEDRYLHTSWTLTQMGCAQAEYIFLTSNTNQYKVFQFRPPYFSENLHSLFYFRIVLPSSCDVHIWILTTSCLQNTKLQSSPNSTALSSGTTWNKLLLKLNKTKLFLEKKKRKSLWERAGTWQAPSSICHFLELSRLWEYMLSGMSGA